MSTATATTKKRTRTKALNAGAPPTAGAGEAGIGTDALALLEALRKTGARTIVDLLGDGLEVVLADEKLPAYGRIRVTGCGAFAATATHAVAMPLAPIVRVLKAAGVGATIVPGVSAGDSAGRVRAGRLSAELRRDDATRADAEALGWGAAEGWTSCTIPDSADFFAALRRVFPSAKVANDDGRDCLCGVVVEPTTATLTATDGHRLTRTTYAPSSTAPSDIEPTVATDNMRDRFVLPREVIEIVLPLARWLALPGAPLVIHRGPDGWQVIGPRGGEARVQIGLRAGARDLHALPFAQVCRDAFGAESRSLFVDGCALADGLSTARAAVDKCATVRLRATQASPDLCIEAWDPDAARVGASYDVPAEAAQADRGAQTAACALSARYLHDAIASAGAGGQIQVGISVDGHVPVTLRSTADAAPTFVLIMPIML